LTSFTGESLEILSLDENLAITGSLSVFFSTVSKTLAEFYCEKCSIPGTIPGQLLRELSNLRALKLEAVGLGGSLPAQFGVLSKLTSLELGGNSLVGSIPEAIADLPQLVKVELYDNQLVGDLLVFSSNSLQILNLVSIDFTCVEQ
jgi:Leucine-rich repeat (LRR) protein